MTRWMIMLGGATAALLVLWQTASMMPPKARQQLQLRVADPAPPAMEADSGNLLLRIVRDGQIDPDALSAIEAQGSAVRAANAYFLAAQFERDHGHAGPALDYMRRAVDLAGEHPALRNWYALLLLENGQVEEAVALSEHAAQLDPTSPDAQRIMGLAYYQTGRTQDAIEAWERCLALAPNEDVARELAKARREAAVEAGFSETASDHFVLRFEADNSAEGLAPQVLRTLEDQYNDLAGDLGIVPNARITVVLYNRRQFYDVTHAPWWSGAQNDGKLRIPLAEARTLTQQVRSILRHELTHSFIQAKVRQCPVWLNEGLAQLEESRSLAGLSPTLQERLRLGDAPPVAELEGSFLDLGPSKADLAYAKSLAAAEYLRSTYGMDGLRTLLTAMAEGRKPETALRELTSAGYPELEQEITGYVNRRP